MSTITVIEHLLNRRPNILRTIGRTIVPINTPKWLKGLDAVMGIMALLVQALAGAAHGAGGEFFGREDSVKTEGQSDLYGA